MTNLKVDEHEADDDDMLFCLFEIEIWKKITFP